MSFINKPKVGHPSLPTNALGLTRRQYEGSMSTLCAGCGHDSVTAAMIEEYGGVHGLRDQGALESAVFRPQTGYYTDLSEEAAALLESLVNNHAFLDGNKRVGFAAAHTFLLVNGFDALLFQPDVAR